VPNSRVIEANHCSVVGVSKRRDRSFSSAGLCFSGHDPPRHAEIRISSHPRDSSRMYLLAPARSNRRCGRRQPLKARHRRKGRRARSSRATRAAMRPPGRFNLQRQAAPHRLDFGKLRHGNGYAPVPNRLSFLPDGTRTNNAEAEFGPPVAADEQEGAVGSRPVFRERRQPLTFDDDLMSSVTHRRWKAEMVARVPCPPWPAPCSMSPAHRDISRHRLFHRLAPSFSRVFCDVERGPHIFATVLSRGRNRTGCILAGIEWLGGDAEALPIRRFAPSGTSIPIAFGLRNVTRIGAPREGAACAEAGRQLPVPRIHAGDLKTVCCNNPTLYGRLSASAVCLRGRSSPRPRRLHRIGREQSAAFRRRASSLG